MLNYSKLQSIGTSKQTTLENSVKLNVILTNYSVHRVYLAANYQTKQWSSYYLAIFKFLQTDVFSFVLKGWLTLPKGSTPNLKTLSSSLKPLFVTTKNLLIGNEVRVTKIGPQYSTLNYSIRYSNYRFKNVFKWLLLNLTYLNLSLYDCLLNSYKNNTFSFYIDFNLIGFVNSDYFRINLLK